MWNNVFSNMHLMSFFCMKAVLFWTTLALVRKPDGSQASFWWCPHITRTEICFHPPLLDFSFGFFGWKPSQNLVFYKSTLLWEDFPTKWTLVIEMINHWLTAASNSLMIQGTLQKYWRTGREDRNVKKAQKRGNLHKEQRRFKWKQRIDLPQCARVKPDATQKDYHTGKWSGGQSHRSVPRHRK